MNNMVESNKYKYFTNEDFDYYDINCTWYLQENCIIFNKEFKNEHNSLSVKIHWKYTNNDPESDITDECIKKINEYLQWLGNCKNELIEYYTNMYNEKFGKNGKMTIEEMIEEGWYEELEICSVEIFIEDYGKMRSKINCILFDEQAEDYDYLSIYIETEDKKINSMDLEKEIDSYKQWEKELDNN